MSNAFFGEYDHNLDDKGRLILPARFRDSFQTPFVVTKGLDHCLFVFASDEWEAFQQKLKELPLADKDARNFTRFFFAGAAECSLDKQGRMMLPPHLRKYAELSGETKIVGVFERLEIWNPKRWEACSDVDATSFADKMAELGI